MPEFHVSCHSNGTLTIEVGDLIISRCSAVGEDEEELFQKMLRTVLDMMVGRKPE